MRLKTLRPFKGLALVNDLAKRRIIGLQQRSLRGDFHGLGVCANLQYGVDASTLLHLHVNGVALEALEAGLIHINGVSTWIQVEEGIGTVLICSKCLLCTRAGAGQSNLRARDSGARGILHRS
jgi:hypothetical protein